MQWPKDANANGRAWVPRSNARATVHRETPTTDEAGSESHHLAMRSGGAQVAGTNGEQTLAVDTVPAMERARYEQHVGQIGYPTTTRTLIWTTLVIPRRETA